MLQIKAQEMSEERQLTQAKMCVSVNFGATKTIQTLLLQKQAPLEACIVSWELSIRLAGKSRALVTACGLCLLGAQGTLSEHLLAY